MLIDPRSDLPFYIVEGHGDQVNEHSRGFGFMNIQSGKKNHNYGRIKTKEEIEKHLRELYQHRRKV